ncbi:MAG: dihydropteridine reductase [Clostridia bacterium]|nr:dihydropteridine reductase [Clostridia bacterium]
MKNNETTIRKIRDSYLEKEPTKLDELKALNKKIIRPAKVFAYVFGSVGSLIIGTGMCLAMKVIGAGLSFGMPLGIIVGLIGILLVSVNYSIYSKKILSRRRKHADEIITLSNELLNAN